MKKNLYKTIFGVLLAAMVLLSSCDLLKDAVEPQPTPTKDLMEGIWKVTEARDSAGNDILPKISIPAVFFQLNADNGINATSGPMISMLVYGDNEWTEVQSKIGQCFNYANLSFTTGEFFIAQGVVPRFTLEMKLRGIGGTAVFEEILGLFGANTSSLAQSLDKTVYHKFMDVKIDFENEDSRMIWTFDDVTTTLYNIKDQYGNYVLWTGWQFPYKKGCQFVLEKQVSTLNDLVIDAYAKDSIQ